MHKMVMLQTAGGVRGYRWLYSLSMFSGVVMYTKWQQKPSCLLESQNAKSPHFRKSGFHSTCMCAPPRGMFSGLFSLP